MQLKTESSAPMLCGALWLLLMPVVPALLPAGIGMAIAALGFAAGIALVQAGVR